MLTTDQKSFIIGASIPIGMYIFSLLTWKYSPLKWKKWINKKYVPKEKKPFMSWMGVPVTLEGRFKK